ncbi:MAG: DUF3048 domain-containing protein [Micrococcales bacterium]
MSRINRTAQILSIAATAALLGGCASATGASPSGSSTPTPTPTPTPMVAAPLTGVEYPQGSNSFLAGPVVMGKIDNSSEARPQLGLNSTDVVIDEMVEGGLTRFLAIWHSKMPVQFGPLRSVRPMDPDLATGFGGIINYSGGQAPFVRAMQATGIYNGSETSEMGKKTMTRVTDRVAPHNLFVNAQVQQSQHMNLGAPKPFLSFVTDPAQSSAATEGKPVISVKAQFPAATALWNWKNGLWLRTQDGKPLTDAGDKQQISAVNVVVLRVAVDRSFKDPRYGFVPKTLLEGSGTGTVFSNGDALKVTWTKTTQAGYVQLTDASGNPVKLAAGNTWFELVPSDVGNVTITYPAAPKPTPTPTPTK